MHTSRIFNRDFRKSKSFNWKYLVLEIQKSVASTREKFYTIL